MSSSQNKDSLFFSYGHDIYEKSVKDIKSKLDVLDSTVNSVGSYDKDLIELKEQISVGLQKSNQIMDKVDSLMSDESAAEVMLP